MPLNSHPRLESSFNLFSRVLFGAFFNRHSYPSSSANCLKGDAGMIKTVCINRRMEEMLGFPLQSMS